MLAAFTFSTIAYLPSSVEPCIKARQSMAKVYLEPDEIEQLESSAKYLRDKLLIMLLFRLGCRISEALALTSTSVAPG